MTYDFIFSAGQWCATATYLSKYALRSSSGPFDWFLAHHVPFAVYVDVICRDFGGFMTADSIRPDPTAPGRYVDSTTQMVSMHDFRTGHPFVEELPGVVEKFRRRVARFRASMAAAKSVLLVRCVQAAESDPEDLRAGLVRLRTKYPGKVVDLVVLQHDAQAAEMTSSAPMGGLTVYRARFFDRDGQPVIGNVKLCGRVFRTLRVRGRWRNICWKRMKTLRSWLRKRLKTGGAAC